ncbi:MAG: hypothetical protein DSY76_08545 [Bacteroidetes bacterium]|nr:MAG: hypothetical protein DSY76_08545 [Bacteroidota bacterium]
MKKLLLIISLGTLASILILSSSSCKKSKKWDYEKGHFSTTPVNLSFLNTAYDDYNSTLNQSGETFPLCFSTNRKSNGSQFDIIYKLIQIVYDWETKDLSIKLETSGNLDVAINNNSIYSALSKINTSANEFGPFMVNMGIKKSTNSNWGQYYSYLFLYSNDVNGQQDIRFVENRDQENYTEAKEVKFLNSSFDDAYPSFNKNDSGLYFCSNREGEFNIYYASIDFSSRDWPTIFSDTTQKQIVKVNMLSSDSADKCPFILGNTMVFTSKRPGGYGGFDLYYSKFEDGHWSEPINFGSKINTAADEYRPIVRREEGFDNDFMIFSSNRQGGKGGFDLYYVGIDKIPY